MILRVLNIIYFLHFFPSKHTFWVPIGIASLRQFHWASRFYVFKQKLEENTFVIIAKYASLSSTPSFFSISVLIRALKIMAEKSCGDVIQKNIFMLLTFPFKTSQKNFHTYSPCKWGLFSSFILNNRYQYI